MDLQNRAGRIVAALTAITAWACLGACGAAGETDDCAGEQELNQATDRDFSLTFRSLMDPVGPGAAAYMTVTRVDSRGCRALMVLNRHGGDQIDVPIGLFATTLSGNETDDLRSAVESIDWAALPRATRGDVNAALLELDYRRGATSVDTSFSAANFETINALSPLMQRLDALGGSLLDKPARAVSVAVVRTRVGFKLVLTNVGRGAVVLADPRPASESGPAGPGTVAVAKLPDAAGGFQPTPEFTPIPLRPAPAGARVVTLAPGQQWEAETVPWDAAAPGDYVAKASWTDYAGPSVEPQSVMPMVPAPGAEGDARPYPLTGAVFSAFLPFSAN